MEKIDPKKEYSKYEIYLLGVLGKTYVTVTKRILMDRTDGNLLKAVITGKGTAIRYKIKGANLIKYLES